MTCKRRSVQTDKSESGKNLYLATSTQVRRVDAITGIITLVAANLGAGPFSSTPTGTDGLGDGGPATAAQFSTIQGVAVDSVAAPAGVLTVQIAGQTNTPPSIVASIQRGALVTWPTTANTSWTLQAANAPGNSVTWTTLLGPSPGNGTSNALFDPLWPEPDDQYQVLQVSSGTSNILVNGGFENGNGTSVDNWSEDGSQPPVRINTDSHSGSYCMELSVTNPGATPNTSQIDQNVAAQGGMAVVPGQTYNFSFWAKQAGDGVSYVQNYGINWLNSGGGVVGNVGLTGFSGGNGVWNQINVNNLTDDNNFPKCINHETIACRMVRKIIR